MLCYVEYLNYVGRLEHTEIEVWYFWVQYYTSLSFGKSKIRLFLEMNQMFWTGSSLRFDVLSFLQVISKNMK